MIRIMFVCHGNICRSPMAEFIFRDMVKKGERAVQLKKSDYDKYDYFICMDSDNIRNTMRIFGDDKDGKVCKMMSFAGMNRDVSDPWYSGDFEQAYNDIYSGCKGLFEKFKGKA